MTAPNPNGYTNWSTLTNVGMLMLIVVGAFWALAFGPIQDKFATFSKRMDENDASMIRIQSSFDTRRNEFTTQKEFVQFEARALDRLTLVEKQLLQIETTRPTTGELQATARSADQNITKLEERLRSLEVYLRQAK